MTARLRSQTLQTYNLEFQSPLPPVQAQPRSGKITGARGRGSQTTQTNIHTRGTTGQCAGNLQHALAVLDAHQGIQELWNRRQPCASSYTVAHACLLGPTSVTSLEEERPHMKMGMRCELRIGHGEMRLYAQCHAHSVCISNYIEPMIVPIMVAGTCSLVVN
jgi:hypothetical protein